MAKHIKINLLGEMKRVPVTIIHRQRAARANNEVQEAFTLSSTECHKWHRRSRPNKKVEEQQKVVELTQSLYQQRLHVLSAQSKRLIELLTT